MMEGAARARQGPAGQRAMLFLVVLGAVILAGFALVPPIRQDAAYHAFADQRAFGGVPHFWNVVSNLPFIVIGGLGLWRFRDLTTTVLFAGIFLTGIGSAYYHLAPDDGTLFWDRLPMTVGFMGLMAGAIGERAGRRVGVLAVGPLLAVGVASLAVWRLTGDLRLYAFVQFYPVVALPILYWLYPTHTGSLWLIGAAGIYCIAKVLEFADAPIYAAGHLVSGHTLKHLAAATACWALYRFYTVRRPMDAPEDRPP